MHSHTYAANALGGLVRLPPCGLVWALRTLVGTAENVVASHTLHSPEPETLWKLWAFTPNSLAFVEAT